MEGEGICTTNEWAALRPADIPLFNTPVCAVNYLWKNIFRCHGNHLEACELPSSIVYLSALSSVNIPDWGITFYFYCVLVVNTLLTKTSFIYLLVYFYVFSYFSYQLNSDYNELLLHNDVRWLSKGGVLGRFWAIRNDLEMFLFQQRNIKAIHYLDFLQNDDSMELLAFWWT